MNWFKRHLNWAYVMGLIVLAAGIGLLILIINSILFFVVGIEAGSSAYDTTVDIFTPLGLVGAIILTAWVVTQKGRNVVWSLIILAPFGWLVPLFLENKKVTSSIPSTIAENEEEEITGQPLILK